MPLMTMNAGGPKVSIEQLLKAMVDKGASDMHISVGAPPLFRIDGAVLALKLPQLAPEETKHLCYSILSEEQKVKFERENELDFAFQLKNISRFRGNIFMQKGAVGGVFRQIPVRIKTFDELGLPPVVQHIAGQPRGLVLVTGPTGSGKSTTLAAIIDKINTETHQHIMTIEDPIEYVHNHKNCVVNQREIGPDTSSFKGALKYVLRQDPDVVLVGEMRDLETIEAALTIAETGHLVFATLHTNSCAQTMNRVIDVFPAHQQPQIRAQMSFVLQGVMTQLLLPRADGPGRVMAMEVMVPNPAIRNLIRENKVQQIYSTMQMGQDKFGMQTMNQSLYSLLARGLITQDEAMNRSADVDELRTMIEKPVIRRQPVQ